MGGSLKNKHVLYLIYIAYLCYNAKCDTHIRTSVFNRDCARPPLTSCVKEPRGGYRPYEFSLTGVFASHSSSLITRAKLNNYVHYASYLTHPMCVLEMLPIALNHNRSVLH